jgi:hypothetical protein
LTDFQKGDSHVLKDVYGESSDPILGPSRIDEFQVPFYDAVMTSIQDVPDHPQQLAGLNNRLLGYFSNQGCKRATQHQ